ncbi:MAG: OsmC family peroxiredoxin, partial [Alphaproteobacteria bacterium]|nr:OsmC family peroxiredoxin [Alphaproteobacteria bacterium]
KGTHYLVEKHMAESPRRVGRLDLDVYLPASLDATQRRKFEATGNACPVKKSLSEAVIVKLTYHYDV